MKIYMWITTTEEWQAKELAPKVISDLEKQGAIIRTEKQYELHGDSEPSLDEVNNAFDMCDLHDG